MMTNTPRPTKPSNHPERGQSAAEFALVLPVLTLVLFAALEFGTAFWNFQQLSAAASEGARKAAVSRTETNRDDLIRAAVEGASNLDPAKVNVTVSSNWGPGDPVTVTATYPERISVIGLPVFDDDLVSRRTARVEH